MKNVQKNRMADIRIANGSESEQGPVMQKYSIQRNWQFSISFHYPSNCTTYILSIELD